MVRVSPTLRIRAAPRGAAKPDTSVPPASLKTSVLTSPTVDGPRSPIATLPLTTMTPSGKLASGITPADATTRTPGAATKLRLVVARSPARLQTPPPFATLSEGVSALRLRSHQVLPRAKLGGSAPQCASCFIGRSYRP